MLRSGKRSLRGRKPRTLAVEKPSVLRRASSEER